MALAYFVHEGQHIDYTPGSAKVCGDVVELGANDFVGIVTTADGIAANAKGSLQIEGVFECTKTTGTDVLAAGDWLAFGAGGTVAASGTGRHLAVSAAGSGVLTILVKINAR